MSWGYPEDSDVTSIVVPKGREQEVVDILNEERKPVADLDLCLVQFGDDWVNPRAIIAITNEPGGCSLHLGHEIVLDLPGQSPQDVMDHLKELFG